MMSCDFVHIYHYIPRIWSSSSSSFTRAPFYPDGRAYAHQTRYSNASTDKKDIGIENDCSKSSTAMKRKVRCRGGASCGRSQIRRIISFTSALMATAHISAAQVQREPLLTKMHDIAPLHGIIQEQMPTGRLNLAPYNLDQDFILPGERPRFGNNKTTADLPLG